MEWKRATYRLAVLVTALGMFLPLLYGYLPWLRKLFGSHPLPVSVGIMVLGWAVAYFTFDEGNGEELTLS